MRPIQRRKRSRAATLPLGVLVIGIAMAIATPHCLAADGWTHCRVAGPFIVRADFPLRPVESLLDELLRIQDALGNRLGIPQSREWIEIYLFHDQTTYARYIKHYFPSVPYRRALYIKADGPGRIFAYRSEQLAIDLRHESTHALLHASLPMVPLWLDEGLAEYFEIPSDKRAYDNPYLGTLRWHLFFGVTPSLVKLESVGEMEAMKQGEYRAAWAWVHFMLHGPEAAHTELVGFLADIRTSTPPGLLSRRLEREIPDTRRRFAAHFKAWKR